MKFSRFQLVLLLLGLSFGSPALAAGGGVKKAISKTQEILGVLCKLSTTFGLPSTACDVQKVVEEGSKYADTIKTMVGSLRQNPGAKAVQSVLKSVLGGDGAQMAEIGKLINDGLSVDGIDNLGETVGRINDKIDEVFQTRATALFGGSKPTAPAGAKPTAASANSEIINNQAAQGMQLGALATQAQTTKDLTGVLINGEGAQRIAQGLSEDTTAADLLKKSQDAAQRSVLRAQTAVSSRAALQVIGEQLGFIMEQTASNNLNLTQVLAAQAQSSALSTQQLTTLARIELEKRQSEAAGASADFAQLLSSAGQYPDYIEKTLDGWNKTLKAAGDPNRAPNLTNPTR